MKLSFALLPLESTIPVDLKSGKSIDPYRGRHRLPELVEVASKHGIPTYKMAGLALLSPQALANTVVFVCGSPSPAQLTDTVEQLDKLGATPILVVDGFTNLSVVLAAMRGLAEKRFQSALVAQIPGLVSRSRLMLYEFAKGDSTMTLVVVLNAGTPQASVLTIERVFEPFKGFRCFPGGFLDHHLENLLQCCAREGSEETNVSVPTDDLILVDVRSDVLRDHRGHVVDHGYMWLVPPELTEMVRSSVKAGDDARPDSARFVSVKSVLDAGHMAFDHYDLLLAAVRTGKVLPPARLLLRAVRGVMGWLERLALKLEKSDAVYDRFHNR